MKIVHVITRLILGGAQENTIITCEQLARRGHDVTLITGPALGPEGQLFDRAKKGDYEIVVIDELRREINPLYDLAAYFKLRAALRKINPDVVHTHSAKAGILGRVAAWGMKKNSQGRPLVVHGVHGLSFHPYNKPLTNKLYIACERFAAKRTDAFITVADAMTEKSLAAGLGRADMYTTAYSAIDEENFLTQPGLQEIKDFRRKHGINEQAIVLVTIARLAELKGHEYIIESARRLAPRYENCIWLFVGDGRLAGEIKQHIQLVNLGYKFKFTGLLGPEQIPLAIHSSDILVHCSLREGLARVLPQAMLAAKPVVSFDIDGAKEVVNEQTGRLVPPEEVNALTDACSELIEQPALRQSLGINGRQQTKEKFAPQTMVDTIEAVYKKYIYI